MVNGWTTFSLLTIITTHKTFRKMIYFNGWMSHVGNFISYLHMQVFSGIFGPWGPTQAISVIGNIKFNNLYLLCCICTIFRCTILCILCFILGFVMLVHICKGVIILTKCIFYKNVMLKYIKSMNTFYNSRTNMEIWLQMAWKVI